MRYIDPLFRLELCNFYGLNRFLHTRDKKAKRRALALLPLYLLLVAVMAFYAGLLSYGLVLLGAGEAALPYLVAVSSLILFFFGILKAGSVLFSLHGYDILCALPLRQGRIVMSRFLRMYVEDLPIALVAVLPGLAVYGWAERPDPTYYLLGLLAILAVPLLPLAAAALLGAVVAAFSSRMRHKSLATTALTLLLVLGIFLGVSWLSGAGEEALDPAFLRELSAVVTALLGKLYPPALWLGSGEVLPCLIGVSLSLAAFGAVAALTAARFRAVCLRLSTTSARHDYRLSALKSQSRLRALVGREFRRYFASSVYVTNTVIGPLMGLLLASGIFLTGMERMEALFGLPLNVRSLLPFALALPFAMMPPTAVSVSMEGKQWWIAKSLPLSGRDVLTAKVLMTLTLDLPFYLTAQILLFLTLKPSAGELLWLLLVPASAVLFSSVFALAVNLRFPVLEWDSEVRIVKQSAASVLGGLGGTLLPLLGLVAGILAPVGWGSLTKGLFCLLAWGGAAFLYRKCLCTDLSRI